MADQATRPFSPVFTDLNELVRRLASILNLILDGKTNNTGSVTLTTSSLTTTLTDRRIGTNSVVVLSPSNALAGGEMGVYIDGYGKQTCTIHHGSASTTRTFKYAVIG